MSRARPILKHFNTAFRLAAVTPHPRKIVAYYLIVLWTILLVIAVNVMIIGYQPMLDNRLLHSKSTAAITLWHSLGRASHSGHRLPGKVMEQGTVR